MGAHALSAVKAAYVIGQADDPAGTIVVYVFDAPVSCTELGSPGWDSRIADSTGVLEMKLIGKVVGTYPVAAMAQSKQASVNFVLSSRSGTPKEQAASGGSVQLVKLSADGTGEGSFELTFGADTTKGTFAAAACAGGHEP